MSKTGEWIKGTMLVEITERLKVQRHLSMHWGVQKKKILIQMWSLDHINEITGNFFKV